MEDRRTSKWLSRGDGWRACLPLPGVELAVSTSSILPVWNPCPIPGDWRTDVGILDSLRGNDNLVVAADLFELGLGCQRRAMFSSSCVRLGGLDRGEAGERDDRRNDGFMCS